MRPGRCPACGSRQKSMHPATQADGGEVLYICPDSWHDGDPVTEHARTVLEIRRLRRLGVDRCEATTLGTRCERLAGHDGEHENILYAWIALPPVPGRDDQANPFGR